MKKITTVLFSALLACTAFAAKPNLHQAVAAQSPELTKIALDAGADPNSKYAGAPELYWASILGQMDVIKLLLDKGARVDEAFASPYTPLAGLVMNPKSPGQIAAENAETNQKVLKHFTEEKAKASGWWAITDSTKFSTVADRVKVLLDAGANPNFLLGGPGVVKIGTPFLFAVEKQQLAIVKLMLDSKRVDTELRFNQWAESVDRFVNTVHAGVYVNDEKMRDWAKIPQFNSPLIFAVEKHNLELVKILAEGGADLNNGKKIAGYKNTSYSYLTPLDIAIDKGFTDIADYLAARGAERCQK